MIVLSLDAYPKITDGIEVALDSADHRALEDDTRLTHEEIFSGFYRRLNT